jgi:hypothetical protein
MIDSCSDIFRNRRTNSWRLNRNACNNPQKLATTDNDVTEMPIPAVLIVSTVSATIITVLS